MHTHTATACRASTRSHAPTHDARLDQHQITINSIANYPYLAGENALKSIIKSTPDTSDIVWLVQQSITLPDGTVVQALVPQVYLQVRAGDLRGDGALIAGRELRINTTGDTTNSGTIAGRTLVQISANNINNTGGAISGQQVGLKAARDINNIGGAIAASNTLILEAGRDVNITTTTVSSGKSGNSNGVTVIERVAGLYVGGAAVTAPDGTYNSNDGLLSVKAGRDINAAGAIISNAADNGRTQLLAGKDINLGTITTAASESVVWNAKNYRNTTSSQDIGSTISASGKQGSLLLNAGQDVRAVAATVNAAGDLQVKAARDIQLTSGVATNTVDEAHYVKVRGFLSTTTTTTSYGLSSKEALASSFSGQTVLIDAGRDLSIKGSSVIADNNLTLLATNNITITTSQNTQDESNFKSVRKSGLMGSGGFGVFIGSKTNSTDIKNQSITNTGSTIGSVGGNVTILAGNNAAVQGSKIVAPGGDITLLGKNVSITDVQNTNAQQTETRFRQSGVTVSVSNPLISAAETLINTAKAISETKDSRSQALGAASLALYGYNNAGAIRDAGKALANSKLSDAGSISISLGTSRSQSNSSAASSTSVGSQLAAGGNLSITATGGGKDSNLQITGSQIRADNNISLSADNQVTLQAGINTASSKSTSKSSSASIGVSLGAQTGVTLSGSRSRGNSDGSDISYTNTEVTAGCTRRLNIDHLCRLKLDQGRMPIFKEVGCG